MKTCNSCINTVKSHFKALGLYNFKGVLGGLINGGAYIRVGLYPSGLINGIRKNVLEQQDKTHLRNELKLTYHYILSYIYNTFIVCQ